jgi:O-antigen/teichoic acid export membrane protein
MEPVLKTSAETLREKDATRKHIRGSSLLLFGRMLSLGINFFTQVLMVRYLSTRDFGVFAYGLAVVGFFRLFASLGLQDAIPRFVPIYQENREYGKMFGTIFLAMGAVLATGIVIVAVVWQAPMVLMPFMNHESLPSLGVLSILIALVPVETADALLDGLFASFAGTRDIFFRRYLLGPGLKFVVVVLLLWMKSTIMFLAYGYLVAGATGVLVYGSLLIKLLREQGLLQRFRLKDIDIPFRETLAFVLPGLISALAMCISPVNAFLLGRLRTMPEVAFYRAAGPVAELNNIVFASFTLLYTPLAARLFARADYRGINGLYWRTATWMSVLSFPIFAVTFSLAKPLTMFLYGARYAPSGPVLALLSLASYFNVLLGFNLQTLKVIKRWRYVVHVSALTTFANLVVTTALIKQYGVIGAAIGSAVTPTGYNLLLQAGLTPTADFHIFDRRYLSVYLTIASGACGLFLVGSLTSLSFYSLLPFAACISFCVFAVAKKKLSIAESFPELRRLPFMRLIFSQET